MKITIYELLGMVKDGKELPKKVKYAGVIFENKDGDLLNDIDCSLFEHRGDENEKLLSMLNDEVEILEEEKKIPEKITLRAGLVGDINNKIENLDINIMTVEDKLNQIIDYLKSKGE